MRDIFWVFQKSFSQLFFLLWFEIPLLANQKYNIYRHFGEECGFAAIYCITVLCSASGKSCTGEEFMVNGSQLSIPDSQLSASSSGYSYLRITSFYSAGGYRYRPQFKCLETALACKE